MLLSLHSKKTIMLRRPRSYSSSILLDPWTIGEVDEQFWEAHDHLTDGSCSCGQLCHNSRCPKCRRIRELCFFDISVIKGSGRGEIEFITNAQNKQCIASFRICSYENMYESKIFIMRCKSSVPDMRIIKHGFPRLAAILGLSSADHAYSPSPLQQCRNIVQSFVMNKYAVIIRNFGDILKTKSIIAEGEIGTLHMRNIEKGNDDLEGEALYIFGTKIKLEALDISVNGSKILILIHTDGSQTSELYVIKHLDPKSESYYSAVVVRKVKDEFVFASYHHVASNVCYGAQKFGTGYRKTKDLSAFESTAETLGDTLVTSAYEHVMKGEMKFEMGNWSKDRITRKLLQCIEGARNLWLPKHVCTGHMSNTEATVPYT